MKNAKILEVIDFNFTLYNIQVIKITCKNNTTQKRYIYKNITTTLGRIKEDIVRTYYNISSDLKENISHTIQGDLTINGIEYNVKSINFECKSQGDNLEDMINYYISIDASEYLLYIALVDNKLYLIQFNWIIAKQFLLKFGRKEKNKIRVKDNKNHTKDKKILEWILANA